MISIKNRDEILKMRESNRIVALLLHEVRELIKPGISTKELDEFAEDLIRKEGGIPAFKGYQIPGLKPFPGAICASINDCIVHGIPSPEKKLRDGDIIGIDVGVLKNGFYGDGAFTYIVGSSTEKIDRLLQVTKEALNRGIAAAKDGARVGDISFAIGSFVRKNGYFVADNLTGHGIGTQLHEDPIVPNFGRKGKGPRLREGMTIAIEPMVNIGTNRVTERGWEFFVADGSLSAHFEHTILITDNEPEILTRI
ncbi:MAG: type I methionyl aminopeptidase [Candidatus Cloacimonadota bacterium]|nr:MAG: type I methionyl aminopeptidase [Candidatus Cloacimonadota bacterium]